METLVETRNRKGKYLMVKYHSDVFQENLVIVVFPFRKIDERLLRRLTGDMETTWDNPDCPGSVFTNDETNTDILVLMQNEDGSIYEFVKSHEVLHVATNVFGRIHQEIDPDTGKDEVFANVVGTVSERVFSLLQKHGIPLIKG